VEETLPFTHDSIETENKKGSSGAPTCNQILKPGYFMLMPWRGTCCSAYSVFLLEESNGSCVLSASIMVIVWETLKQSFGMGTVFSTILVSTAVLITVSLLAPSPEESRLSRFFPDSFSLQQSNKHMRGI
jgi:hypothetical protein